MSLVLDERLQLQGQPGLHVLIAGVSRYIHFPGGGGSPTTNSFGMQQLFSTALTAYKIYQWLLSHKNQLPLPLATIRLLLSPSQDELDAEPAMVGLADPATRRNFAAEAHGWHDDAGSSDDNMSFFYFAGHGVQRKKDDAVMLLEDFGDPLDGPLSNAVEIENFFGGMAPPADPTKKIAQKQLYFIDACRIAPQQFKALQWLNVPDIWAVELSGRDDRSAPIFFAAIPGTKAYALKGQQTIFSEALIRCLDGLGSEPMEEDAQGQVKWRVNAYALSKALTAQIDELNKKYQLDQNYTPGGLFKDITINHLNNPPAVNVSVEIDPNTAVPYIALEVRDYMNNIVWSVPPHPYVKDLPAGHYIFKAKVANPPPPPLPSFVDFTRPLTVKPPTLKWKAKVI
jgi:hypothetical protein